MNFHSLFRQMQLVATGLAFFLIVASGAAPAASAGAVSVVSADVKILSASATSVASGNSVVTQTQLLLQNDNDDDARNVQLVLTLPPTSHVLTAPANAVIPVTYADPSTAWRTVGEVTIGLDTIAVGQTVTISLSTEMLAAQVTPATSIGVFVFGSLPDPNAANNFRSLSIHL